MAPQEVSPCLVNDFKDSDRYSNRPYVRSFDASQPTPSSPVSLTVYGSFPDPNPYFYRLRVVSAFITNTFAINSMTLSQATPAPATLADGQHSLYVDVYRQNSSGQWAWVEGTSSATLSVGLQTTVTTNPPDLEIIVDNVTMRSPKTFSWATGSTHTINTPSPQLNGNSWTFSGWSDGLAQSHTITVPATSTTYTANFSVQGTPPPAPWVSQDIGTVGPAGSTNYVASPTATYTVKGSGSAIFGGDDSFHFLHQQVSGTATIIARLASFQTASASSKAGIMFRESLSPSARNVFLAAHQWSGDKRVEMQWRDSPYFTDYRGPAPSWAAGIWLKLERNVDPNPSNNWFKGYTSPDGFNWTLFYTQPMSMSNTVYVGLAVSAENNSALATAVFESVLVNQQVITLQTSPAGRKLTINGTPTTCNPCSLQGSAGTSYSVVASDHVESNNTRYKFTGWVDGVSGASRNITIPTAQTTYTANFSTEYLLTTSVIGSGSVSKSPPSTDGYYASGAPLTLTPLADYGHQFQAWSGDAAGIANPLNVAMNGPKRVTATFSAIPSVRHTFHTVPPGLSLIIDGQNKICYPYCTADWIPGSIGHGLTASANAPYTFQNWTKNAPLASGGMIVSQSAGWSETAPSSPTVYYANYAQAQPNFLLVPTPAFQSTAPSNTVIYSVTVNVTSGVTGPITFTVPGLRPDWVTYSFSPPSLNGAGTTSLTVTTSSTVPENTTLPLAITGTAGSVSRSTTASLAVSPRTSATMLTPANGGVLKAGPTTFSWTPGTGVTQYSLVLSSTQSYTNDYPVVISGLSGTATMPTSNLNNVVYAKLGSLVNGSWDYKYTSYRLRSASSSLPRSASTVCGDYTVLNNGERMIWSYLISPVTSDAGQIDPSSLRVLNSNGSTDGNVGATLLNIPSVSCPGGPYQGSNATFDVAFTAGRNATPGPRGLRVVYVCNAEETYPECPNMELILPNALTIKDSTPRITSVTQNPPEVDGSFYVIVGGENLGTGGDLNICKTTFPCAEDFDRIADSLTRWTSGQVIVRLKPRPGTSGDYLVQIKVVTGATGNPFQAPPGGQDITNQLGTVRVQATSGPIITGLSLDTIGVGPGNQSLTISGSGFASSPQVNLPQGWVLNSQGSSANNIVILVSVGPSAKLGANAISVTVSGVKSNDAAITVTADVHIQLDRVGPTVISTDGNYSEDTTIRVTAVLPTRETLTGFTGAVNVVEVGAIYSQNGGTLPPAVQITSGGTATFLVRSLAGPKDESAGLPPDPAYIKSANFPMVEGANLRVDQWVVSSPKLHSLAADGVYDWMQARVRDVFSAASGDLASVLAAVESYSILPGGDFGQTPFTRAPKSPIKLNPYSNLIRLNTVMNGRCGQPGGKALTVTLLHEARHAFQSAMSAVANNDPDQDWLANNITIAPTTVFLDTTSPRNVCLPSGTTVSKSYLGPMIPDPFEHAIDALEMDAYVFVPNHTN